MPRPSLRIFRKSRGSGSDKNERSRSESHLLQPRLLHSERSPTQLFQNAPSANADQFRARDLIHHHSSQTLLGGVDAAPPRPENLPGFYPEIPRISEDQESNNLVDIRSESEREKRPSSRDASVDISSKQNDALYLREEPGQSSSGTRPELEVAIPQRLPQSTTVTSSNPNNPQSTQQDPFLLSPEILESWTDFLQRPGSYQRRRRPHTVHHPPAVVLDSESPAPSSPGPLETIPRPSRVVRRQPRAITDDSHREVGVAKSGKMYKAGEAKVVNVGGSSSDVQEMDAFDIDSNFSNVSLVFSAGSGGETPGTPPSVGGYGMLEYSHDMESSEDGCSVEDGDSEDLTPE